MFKSAINGFDRKAVMSYIFELNESAQAVRKKLSEQLEEAVHAKEAMEQQFAENNQLVQRYKDERDSMASEIEGERTRCGELTEQLESLGAEIDRLKLAIAQKDEELETLRTQLAQQPQVQAPPPAAPQPAKEEPVKPQPVVQAAPAAAPLTEDMQEKYREMEEKRLEVERASAQIGRLLLDATADADRKRTEGRIEAEQMLEKAKIEADDIVRSAKEEAGKLMAEARYQADKIVVGANASLEEANRKFAGIRQYMAAAQRTILGAICTMQDKAQSIGGIMDSVEHKMIAAEKGDRDDDSGTGGHGGQSRNDGEGFFRFAADK